MVEYGSLPFDEQIRFFIKKHPVLTRAWTDVYASEHDYAFMVAGAAKADLLSDFRGAIEKAIASGTTLEQFRKDFDAIVERHGWSYTGGRNWRTRVIFETNLRQSYNAGREAQMNDPQLKKRRPFGLYRHGRSEHPRPEHLAWDGTVLPLDDEWWDTHTPQNGWGCKCKKFMASAADVRRLGLKVNKTAPPIQWEEKIVGVRGPSARTVRVPKGIDPGFEYRPGFGRQFFIRDKIESLPPDIGALLKAEVDDSPLFTIADKELNDGFNAAFADMPEKYRPMVGRHAPKIKYEKESRGVSHYQNGTIRINMDLEARTIQDNPAAKGQVFRHEFGHAVSHRAARQVFKEAFWMSEQQLFRKAFTADARALGASKVSLVADRINADLAPGGAMGKDWGLSDFFGCLTKNRIRGCFGHTNAYLRRSGAGREEVLADVFEMLTRKDTAGIEYARKFAPNVVKAGEELFDKVAGENG